MQSSRGVRRTCRARSSGREEAGYLAGYLAALMEKRRPGRDVIGSVGGYKFPGVDRWILALPGGREKA